MGRWQNGAAAGDSPPHPIRIKGSSLVVLGDQKVARRELGTTIDTESQHDNETKRSLLERPSSKDASNSLSFKTSLIDRMSACFSIEAEASPPTTTSQSEERGPHAKAA
jgi:hypothetical protein